MSYNHFKDHFSKQAAAYFKYRPQYPQDLFAFLSSLCAERCLAWDCGTGNGQAAVGLSHYFDKVVASDPSEAQINAAFRAPNIEYKIAPAERSGLESGSIDLVTVANALHWFDFPAFYAEVNRILKPEGLLAVWCYGCPIHNSSKSVNDLISYLHNTILGDYWLAENRLVENKYKDVSFPFSELPVPELKMEKHLSHEGLLGLFHSWSAVQRFKDKTQRDPVTEIEKDLHRAWGSQEFQAFHWELTVRVGRKLI